MRPGYKLAPTQATTETMGISGYACCTGASIPIPFCISTTHGLWTDALSCSSTGARIDDVGMRSGMHLKVATMYLYGPKAAASSVLRHTRYGFHLLICPNFSLEISMPAETSS